MRQSKHQKGSEIEPVKGKNLILVSNNSELFQDVNVPNIFSRNSSFGLGDVSKDYRRNSSFNNLFSGFRNQQRLKEQPQIKQTEELSQEQKYAQQCLEYEKYQYDDKIRMIIHRMAIKAYHSCRDKASTVFLSFFIERFLCTLSKKLLLNKFELLFLEYVFEESKWRFELEVIKTYSSEFRSYIHIPESEGNHQAVKYLQIYLIYCAYYSKKSLNQFPTDNIYNSFLKSICDKFKERFGEWTQSSGIANIKINPKILNNIFKRLNSYNERDRQSSENYNIIVEEILDISPAYNSDPKAKGKRKKKKKEAEERSQVVKEELANQSESLINNEEIPDFPLPYFQKKKTSYVSNVDGLDPTYHYRNL